MTTSPGVRQPAVAGMFYPAEAGDLRDAVDAAMARACSPGPEDGSPVKAVIAPHAGYRYSGPVAASAYARLVAARDTIERVVLIGPAHRARLGAVAAGSADAWATPLGQVPVDVAGRDRLLGALPSVVIDDRAHCDEHSLEVHLPFLQRLLGDITILPLVVGQVDAGAVADVLEQAWGGPETAIVVSTDLSHYHDQITATGLDRATAAAIVARRPELVGPDGACGVFAVRGLLVAARRRGLDLRLLDLRTSADTAGGPDRVVGYGSFATAEPRSVPSAATPPAGIPAGRLKSAEAELLLDLAEDALRTGLMGGDRQGPAEVPASLLEPGGVFVTLEVADVLNGCIGAIESDEPLAQAVPRLTLAAAFEDPRLPRLTATDWPRLRIKISLLSALQPIPAATRADVLNALGVGVDGLVLAAGSRRATFLPVMWRSLPERTDFVHHLLRKAGIPPGRWPGDMKAWTYTTVELSRSVAPRP